MPKIILPKNWDKLTHKEQIEWINQHFMIKEKNPILEFLRESKVKEGLLKLSDGSTIKIEKGKRTSRFKKNPKLIIEETKRIGTRLITLFHYENSPYSHYLGVSNPHSGNRICFDMSFENCSELIGVIMRYAYKLGVYSKKKHRKRRKK